LLERRERKEKEGSREAKKKDESGKGMKSKPVLAP
jgi:hypothetical protein